MPSNLGIRNLRISRLTSDLGFVGIASQSTVTRSRHDPIRPQLKKLSFPIRHDLHAYQYRRERNLPVSYERLRFHRSGALMGADGKPILWESVVYDRLEMEALSEDLADLCPAPRMAISFMRHLYVDRVDFRVRQLAPFRIRIVNAFNDNAITTM
ncbi:MAG: hypothetical protein LC114_02635 [Bryobacterales bacterium]|nr:hypothetical protein [Bryobacterales bacterium]